MAEKKTKKTRCKNCGDEFIMPDTAIGPRVKLWYCTGCFRMWSKHTTTEADRFIRFGAQHSDKDTPDGSPHAHPE